MAKQCFLVCPGLKTCQGKNLPVSRGHKISQHVGLVAIGIQLAIRSMPKSHEHWPWPWGFSEHIFVKLLPAVAPGKRK